MKRDYCKRVKELFNFTSALLCRFLILFLLLFVLEFLCTRDVFETYNTTSSVLGTDPDVIENDNRLDSFVAKQEAAKQLADYSDASVVGYLAVGQSSKIAVRSVSADIFEDELYRESVPVTFSSYNKFARDLTLIVGTPDIPEYYSQLNKLIDQGKIKNNFSIEYEQGKSREFTTFAQCTVKSLDELSGFSYKEALQFLQENNCIKAEQIQSTRSVAILVFISEKGIKRDFVLVGGYVK